ncbi:MAG: hypothetical protein XD75_0197 [Parcubacteria bacterium 33_209]|nr:MAG: hypothetical protein XD75_0197 [Parcubacteria bacterium 33_209]
MVKIRLNVNFKVEKERIIFFENLFFSSEQKDSFYRSIDNLNYTKNNWRVNKKICEEIINIIFSKYYFKERIRVIIFPSNFYLGAAETKENLILFGQKNRSKNFSTAVILHEITHILLSKIKTKRDLIIDEIICYLVEEFIYSKEGARLEDIWNKKELDNFHLKAMEAVINYREELVFSRLQVDCLIGFFKEKLPNEILNVLPEPGLLSNLKRESKNNLYVSNNN